MLVKNFLKQMTFLYRYISLAVLMIVLATACQATVPNRSNLQAGHLSAADCRIVKHAGGETPICGTPQRVAALEPKLLSMMLALGVQPSAYADAYLVRSPQFDNPSQQIPYLGDFVTSQPLNLGARQNPSLEALSLIKPDLILGLSVFENSLLSSIAPTVLIDNLEENWQSNIQIVAKALNREEKVKQVIASQQQQVAEARAKLAPLINSQLRVLHLICSQSMDYIEIGYDGDSVQLLEELGFRSMPLEDEQKPELRSEISIETLSQLDADIIIVSTWLDNWQGESTYKVPLEKLKEKWSRTPLLHNSKAWKSGRVYFVDYTLWGSVIGRPIADFLILEQLLTLLLSPA